MGELPLFDFSLEKIIEFQINYHLPCREFKVESTLIIYYLYHPAFRLSAPILFSAVVDNDLFCYISLAKALGSEEPHKVTSASIKW